MADLCRMSCTDGERLTVHVGKEAYPCPDGEVLQIDAGTGLISIGPCPANHEACKSLACKQDCNARGRCEGIPRICQCFLGWTGEACERRIPSLLSIEDCRGVKPRAAASFCSSQARSSLNGIQIQQPWLTWQQCTAWPSIQQGAVLAAIHCITLSLVIVFSLGWT